MGLVLTLSCALSHTLGTGLDISADDAVLHCKATMKPIPENEKLHSNKLCLHNTTLGFA